MNAANENIKTALKLALGAIFALDDAGVGVLDVEISGARPVITVDREPSIATPGRAVTEKIGGVRLTSHVAELRGCRVRWTSSAPCRAEGGAA